MSHRFAQILDLFGFEKKHADFADDADFLWMGKRLMIKNPETWKMLRDSVDMRLCSLF